MYERVDLKGKRIGSFNGTPLRAHTVMDITSDLSGQEDGARVLLEFARTTGFSGDRFVGLTTRIAADQPASHSIYPNLKPEPEDPGLQALAATLKVTPDRMCELVTSRPPRIS